MIEYRVIGPLEVAVDGQEPSADLLWRKNVALAVYLARSPNGTRTRDHLVGLLWADTPEDAARHSLRESLRVLRRHAGKDAVTTDGAAIRLDRTAVRLDLDRLGELQELGDWHAAARVIRGEFLEGFGVPDASGFENWMTAERLTLRNRSVEILVRAAEESIVNGDLTAASDWSTRALELEPGADAAVQVAVKSLALMGNRSGALNTFSTFQSYLRELGTEPQPDSIALVERIREGRQWRRRLPASETAPETRRPPLIGRQAQLRKAMECWDACRTHRRVGAILVEGDPGSGKTRLADDFVERARLDGAVVVTVRAIEADADEPWCGMLGMADGGILGGSGVSATDPTVVATLATMSERWSEQFPDAKLTTEPVHLGKCLRDALRSVALEQPVVVLVDDVQWLDPMSLQQLPSLFQKLHDLPILFWVNATVAHDRNEIDRVRMHAAGESLGTVIEVGPLSFEDILALCSWAMPSFDEDHLNRLARRIEVDSGGLALLAVELLHAVASGLELSDGSPSWPQTLRTLDDTLPSDLPDTVVAAIRVAFRRQSVDARQILRVAAVAGGRSTRDKLGAGAGLDGAAMDTALDELEWDRWLVADARGYAFVARIVREVILRDMVTPGQRERISGLIQPATHSSP
ncbi:MAG: AAA family ATPase [Gemmatimonadetes bacterium]|nr:AAA family ATPase [Gemmatimonadota bacterium]